MALQLEHTIYIYTVSIFIYKLHNTKQYILVSALYMYVIYVQCTAYSVLYTVYSVQCTMYSVHCAVYSV